MKKYFSSSDEIEQCRREYLKIRNRPSDPLPRLETRRAPFFDPDVNAINEIGFTRLWYAVLEDQDATETKRLLEAKANVHFRDDADEDLLLLSISNKVSFQCIKLLLDYGARSNCLLHHAVHYQNEDVFSHVLANREFESLINSKDDFGYTPLFFECNRPNVYFAEHLLERGGTGESTTKHEWVYFLKAKIKAVKYSIMVFIAVIKRTVPSTIIPLDMRRLLAEHVWSTRFQEPWYQMGEE
jgi:hypothetical protein